MIELTHPKELRFKSDGIEYYIDGTWSEVVEACYGNYPMYDNRIEDEHLINWINDNGDRWELDVE